jgi:hypothetical protein
MATINLINTGDKNAKYQVAAPATLIELINVAKKRCNMTSATLLVNGEAIDSQATYDKIKMTLSVIEVSVVDSDRDYADVHLSLHAANSPYINYVIPDADEVVSYNILSKALVRVQMTSDNPNSNIIIIKGSSWVVLQNGNMFVTGGLLAYELNIETRKVYKRPDLP